jgi:vacuolar-type H+-ATPase subunit I/STV1
MSEERHDVMDNNETVRELRENRIRQYQRKLRALRREIKEATENSYSVLENNTNAFRSI